MSPLWILPGESAESPVRKTVNSFLLGQTERWLPFWVCFSLYHWARNHTHKHTHTHTHTQCIHSHLRRGAKYYFRFLGWGEMCAGSVLSQLKIGRISGIDFLVHWLKFFSECHSEVCMYNRIHVHLYTFHVHVNLEFCPTRHMICSLPQWIYI